jgi:hypothetical protein
MELHKKAKQGASDDGVLDFPGSPRSQLMQLKEKGKRPRLEMQSPLGLREHNLQFWQQQGNQIFQDESADRAATKALTPNMLFSKRRNNMHSDENQLSQLSKNF